MEKSNFLGKRLIIVFLCFLSINARNLCMPASADVHTDNQIIYNQYVNNILIAVNDYPCDEYDYVEGMHVSNDGRFVVVLSSVSTKCIDVYNSNMEFQCQIVLSYAGGVYASFTENSDAITIYLAKDGMKIQTALDGQFISASETQEIPLELWEEYVNGYEKEINHHIYAVQKKGTAKTACVKDETGEIIHQYTAKTNNSTVYIILLLVASVVLIVPLLNGLYRKKQKRVV